MKASCWNLKQALKQMEKEQEQFECGEAIPLHLVTTAEVLKMWFDSQEDV